MPRRRDYDTLAIEAVADLQDGLITRAQLEELGVPGSTVAARCHEGRRWQRVLPGILALQTGPISPRQQLRAALLYAGPQAMITGGAALRLHGVRRSFPVPPIHVLVGDHRQRGTSGFVLVERTIRLPAPVVIEGMRVAPAARSVFDAARRHSSPEDWARTVAQHTEATAIGIVVVHHLPQVVERQPAQTLAQLE
ncbi:MAG TPA: hypothetical protein VMI11_01610, partial [Actinomycetes bacterium]|nr:hypothetical protein [Actinomycetes bacterium]